MGPICNCANRSQSNILVLKCLSLVESNRLVIVIAKPIKKLGFDLGIMPLQKTLWIVSYLFPFTLFSVV